MFSDKITDDKLGWVCNCPDVKYIILHDLFHWCTLSVVWQAGDIESSLNSDFYWKWKDLYLSITLRYLIAARPLVVKSGGPTPNYTAHPHPGGLPPYDDVPPLPTSPTSLSPSRMPPRDGGGYRGSAESLVGKVCCRVCNASNLVAV